jgi:hypothetical protein
MLKDERLAKLANRFNVARFTSFSPGRPEIRFSITGRSIDEDHGSLGSAIRGLLDLAQSVNVRTFLDRESKSTEFVYGLTRADDVEAVVRKFAASGLFTIVNETIDVDDGGVSGVSVGGVTEFAPGATPRVVERTDDSVARLPTHVAERILRTVYGFEPHIMPGKDERLEFSLHPMRVGHRLEHTLLWEVASVPSGNLTVTPTWPNDFSRLVGDKVYGLLVADAFGLRVPRATAIGRRYPPFIFGQPTGTAEVWLRTCPAQATPGHFTTVKGWVDPFALLAKEDPNSAVAAVLAQESVVHMYSGAAMSQLQSEPLIEGVRGRGDDFMLGHGRDDLPDVVRGDVSALIREAEAAFGTVELEWAHDEIQAWMLQVHPRPVTNLEKGVLSLGEAATWLEFDPDEGLDALRTLVGIAAQTNAGVRVTRLVGITSHVGDILRAARVPGRIVPSI